MYAVTVVTFVGREDSSMAPAFVQFQSFSRFSSGKMILWLQASKLNTDIFKNWLIQDILLNTWK